MFAKKQRRTEADLGGGRSPQTLFFGNNLVDYIGNHCNMT